MQDLSDHKSSEVKFSLDSMSVVPSIRPEEGLFSPDCVRHGDSDAIAEAVQREKHFQEAGQQQQQHGPQQQHMRLHPTAAGGTGATLYVLEPGATVPTEQRRLSPGELPPYVPARPVRRPSKPPTSSASTRNNGHRSQRWSSD